eukprot:97936-Hanusia_phi.AAC.1
MNFLGLFNFPAPWLPWVLLAFSVLLGSSPVVDLVGIFVGHVYYYLEDIVPRMPGRFRGIPFLPLLVSFFAWACPLARWTCWSPAPQGSASSSPLRSSATSSKVPSMREPTSGFSSTTRRRRIRRTQ